MRSTDLILLVAALGAWAGAVAADDDRIYLQLPAVMDPGAKLDPDVRAECDLPKMVGSQVLAKAYERQPNVVVLDPALAGSRRFVRVRIVGATTMPGVGMRQIDVY